VIPDICIVSVAFSTASWELEGIGPDSIVLTAILYPADVTPTHSRPIGRLDREQEAMNPAPKLGTWGVAEYHVQLL
jgi:hypothetical protein